MTREILFRGKRVDNGEWVEGYYAPIGEYHYILTGRLALVPYLGFEHFFVNPETVGQFTGLTDRNGAKIFEGDIVQHEDVVSYIVWNPDNLRFEFAYKGNFRESISAKLTTVWGIEVIGNIYDNPELLEVSENEM